MTGDYLDEVLSVRWTAKKLCRKKERCLAEDLAVRVQAGGSTSKTSLCTPTNSTRRCRKAHEAA